jgi:glucose-6-phosphate isomerase
VTTADHETRGPDGGRHDRHESDLWPADEHVALIMVSVSGTDAQAAVSAHVTTLVDDRVASRIADQDPTLWGPEAVDESSKRLGWVALADTSRPLVESIVELRDELNAQGVDRVVLCGMGGSSLAPEVITATAGVDLVTLDSTDPGQVRDAVTELGRTVVVVSSKSGSTVETDSHRRVFEKAFADAGIDATGRIVVVTDPGSPLEASATEAGYRVFRADPSVGGRYSALTAFGLVPSGLAGADISELLDEASAVSDLLADDSEGNPALMLGAALGGTSPLRDKLAFVDLGSGIPGFADWAEQLIAESTGKNGTGLLPVVTSGPAAPESRWPAHDVLVSRLLPPGEDDETVVPTAEGTAAAVSVAGRLGAQLLLWEYATAIAGRLLGINPFDQPDVESAKIAARGLLDARPEPTPPLAVDGAVEIRASAGLLPDGLLAGEGGTTLRDAVAALLEALPADGYLAVMAYLDRHRDAALAGVREPLAMRAERPVTFGWGPRFLHSTGQYHKGGPATGVYLQVTGEPGEDLEVPGRPFTFGQLVTAQAAGDAQVLEGHGRPVLRLHLTDRAAGLEQLIAALTGA